MLECSVIKHVCVCVFELWLLVVGVDQREIWPSSRRVVPRPDQPAAQATEAHGPRSRDQPEQSALEYVEPWRRADDPRWTLRDAGDPGNAR